MPEISEAAVEAAKKVLVNRVGWTQSWPSEHTKSVITEMLIAAAPELIPSLTSRLSAVERENERLRAERDDARAGEENWVRNYESLGTHLDELAAENGLMEEALIKIAGTPTKGSEQIAHDMAAEALAALTPPTD